jgi:hypothetical protein
MARILVQADDEWTVLLDERGVGLEHFSDVESAMQILERLELAVRDEWRSTRRRRPVRHIARCESALTRTFD